MLIIYVFNTKDLQHAIMQATRCMCKKQSYAQAPMCMYRMYDVKLPLKHNKAYASSGKTICKLGDITTITTCMYERVIL